MLSVAQKDDTIESEKPKRRVSVVTNKFLRTRSAKIGAILIAILLAFILIAPLFLPYGPYQIAGQDNSPPSFAHPFGTDYVGHDLLSQVVFGAYPSLLVGLIAAAGAVILGFIVGLFAGYYTKLEPVLSASTDVIMSFPSLVLLIVIGSLFNPTNLLITGSIILVLWAPCARAIRAQVASLKKLPYVNAARTSGMSDRQILWRVVAPGVSSIAMAYFVLIVSISIVLVTALEFVGVGNPDQISWGSILYFAQQYGFYLGDWWWVVAPGAAITIVSAGFALIGFSFEELMNPRLRV